MSGHSRWAKLKHKKGAIDAKKNALFSKLIKEITVAAKLGGDQIEANSRLRLAVAKARDNNLPSKHVEAAIKRGAGKEEAVNYEELAYEAYGPNGVGMMIQCLTDNRNRTVSDVRNALTKNGGIMGESGSVAWQFEKRGIITIERAQLPDEEKMLELALEAGAEDVIVEEEGYTVKTDIPSYIGVIEKLKAQKMTIAESDITYYPKNTVPVDQATADAVAELISVIDDLEDVQTVSSNEVVQ